MSGGYDIASWTGPVRPGPGPLEQGLTSAVATGQGVLGIAAVLHDALGGTVVIDGSAQCRLGFAGDPHVGAMPLPTDRPDGDHQHARAFRTGDWLIAESCPGDELLGAIGLHDPGRNAGSAQGSILEEGAMVLAAEFFRLHSVALNELRVWGDLATELLDNPDTDKVRSHAAALGYDVDRPHRALVVQAAGNGPLPSMESVRRILGASRIDGSLATERSDGIVLLVTEELEWNALGERLNGGFHSQLRLGVGDRHEPTHLGRSVAEAVLALRVSGRQVANVEDLGIARFLAADVDEVRLRSFVHDWLGDLEEYDEANGADLVHTLGVWLRDQRSVRVTAECLHIHQSTLKYRLRRIGELSGRDLHDPEQRFNLDLACRTRHTLEAAEASGLRDAIRSSAGRAPGVGRGSPHPVPFRAAPPSVEVAVLDVTGVITWVNEAWSSFAEENGGVADRCGVGVSYLDACATAPDDPHADLAVSTIRTALAGDLTAPAWFVVPCHSPGMSRWFEVTVAPRRDDAGRNCGATVTFTLTSH